MDEQSNNFVDKKDKGDDEDKTYTITEINNLVNKRLTESFKETIKITGEISNVKVSGGHLYSTLKDQTSSINVIMWRYDTKNIKIQNGDSLTISGSIKGYPKGGSYNFIANTIQKNGIGELHQLYEQTKNAYDKLGYYINKKDFPKSILNVGILTSADGAALQDILFVLNKNSFKGNVTIRNCIVQGVNCPLSIAEGIQYFEGKQSELKLDVLLLARGGGSLEDLIGFSDPLILEKLYTCPIFTISAIGHEIDFMLSDFVADMRAPTPSIAGEVISGQWASLSTTLGQCINASANLRLTILAKINRQQNELEIIKNKVKAKIENELFQMKHTIDKINLNLDNLDMTSVLNKGYCLILNKDGDIVNNLSDIQIGQKLNIKLIDGELEISVKNITTYASD